jgi:hypothetical protein
MDAIIAELAACDESTANNLGEFPETFEGEEVELVLFVRESAPYMRLLKPTTSLTYTSGSSSADRREEQRPPRALQPRQHHPADAGED